MLPAKALKTPAMIITWVLLPLMFYGCSHSVQIRPELPPVTNMAGHCVKADCQKGRGVFALNNGGRYNGMFINGRFNGAGVLTLADGSRFQGNFVDNHYNGGGRVLIKGEGGGKCEINTNCLDGRVGALTMDDGRRLTGTFRNGRLNGSGILKTAAGDELRGTFLNNKLSGRGTIIQADGTSYRGSFKDGLLMAK